MNFCLSVHSSPTEKKCLSNVLTSAQAVSGSFEGLGYICEILADPDTKTIQERLRIACHVAQKTGGNVILYLAGHGHAKNGAPTFLACCKDGHSEEFFVFDILKEISLESNLIVFCDFCLKGESIPKDIEVIESGATQAVIAAQSLGNGVPDNPSSCTSDLSEAIEMLLSTANTFQDLIDKINNRFRSSETAETQLDTLQQIGNLERIKVTSTHSTITKPAEGLNIFGIDFLPVTLSPLHLSHAPGENPHVKRSPSRQAKPSIRERIYVSRYALSGSEVIQLYRKATNNKDYWLTREEEDSPTDLSINRAQQLLNEASKPGTPFRFYLPTIDDWEILASKGYAEFKFPIPKGEFTKYFLDDLERAQLSPYPDTFCSFGVVGLFSTQKWEATQSTEKTKTPKSAYLKGFQLLPKIVAWDIRTISTVSIFEPRSDIKYRVFAHKCN